MTLTSASGLLGSDTCGRCETLVDDALNHHKQSADEAYKQMKIDREQAKEGGCIL